MNSLGSHTILIGDVIEQLRTLPAASVHCVCTSPPYWGLRDYGVDNQIGLEPTIEQYVAKMVQVFSEVRRVLRGDGTLWLNLGDSYASSSGVKTSHPQQSRNGPQGVVGPRDQHPSASRSNLTTLKEYDGLKPKDRCMIPARVALALQADGWWIRQEIVWVKPNPMPESCTDRPTTAHEMVYLLTKSPRYFYDAEAVREIGTGKSWNAAQSTLAANGVKNVHLYNTGQRMTAGAPTHHDDIDRAGRNRRSWWQIPTEAYSAAHFATFPRKLVEPMILAGTSERGCCPSCGSPWVRVVDKETVRRPRPADRTGRHEAGDGVNSCGNTVAGVRTTTTGWRPGCECVEPIQDSPHEPPMPVPCTVLDPFAGSGTTLLVANQHGRDAIGIELSPEYAAMAERRIGEAVHPGSHVDETDATEYGLFK